MELYESIKDWFLNLTIGLQMILVVTPLYLGMKWSNDSYIKQRTKDKLEAYLCPKCLDEFEPHIEMCVDCGEKIMKAEEVGHSETFKKYHT